MDYKEIITSKMMTSSHNKICNAHAKNYKIQYSYNTCSIIW